MDTANRTGLQKRIFTERPLRGVTFGAKTKKISVQMSINLRSRKRLHEKP